MIIAPVLWNSPEAVLQLSNSGLVNVCSTGIEPVTGWCLEHTLHPLGLNLWLDDAWNTHYTYPEATWMMPGTHTTPILKLHMLQMHVSCITTKTEKSYAYRTVWKSCIKLNKKCRNATKPGFQRFNQELIWQK